MGQKSEIKKIFDSDKLIVCFSSSQPNREDLLTFEFHNYLSSLYDGKVDMMFYVDRASDFYHRGLPGITSDVEGTAEYLAAIIKNGKYNNVIFMGVSAGGYAAILFGSLCNTEHVVAFIPVTKLDDASGLRYSDVRYKDLKRVINDKTNYVLYGDTTVKDVNNPHHISQCDNLACFQNVNIVRKKYVITRNMRDNGEIKELLDNLLCAEKTA